ncbi:hypothetical protein G9A89_003577 [Geosiphon pyriformis]|nr:hypothetical protein G9A89_003577 [Geosiphon pyriformis]
MSKIANRIISMTSPKILITTGLNPSKINLILHRCLGKDEKLQVIRLQSENQSLFTREFDAIVIPPKVSDMANRKTRKIKLENAFLGAFSLSTTLDQQRPSYQGFVLLSRAKLTHQRLLVSVAKSKESEGSKCETIKMKMALRRWSLGPARSNTRYIAIHPKASKRSRYIYTGKRRIHGPRNRCIKAGSPETKSCRPQNAVRLISSGNAPPPLKSRLTTMDKNIEDTSYSGQMGKSIVGKYIKRSPNGFIILFQSPNLNPVEHLWNEVDMRGKSYKLPGIALKSFFVKG